jgi:hypothetical protein
MASTIGPSAAHLATMPPTPLSAIDEWTATAEDFRDNESACKTMFK